MTTATSTDLIVAPTTVPATSDADAKAKLEAIKAALYAQNNFKAPVDKESNKILIRPVSECLEWLPKLKVIENVTAKGICIDADGIIEDVEVPIDNGYKLAGHVAADGIFHACPWMKSESYNETAHDFVLGEISNSLDNRGIKHGVWRSVLTRNMSCMRTDLLMEQRYKINEEAFEDNLGVLYNNEDLKGDYSRSTHNRGDIGIYQPCISVINSFFGSSQVLFSLLRIFCLNGMHRIADSLTLSFAHMENDILQKFTERSNRFLDNIFSGKEVENLIMNMQKDQMLIGMFLEWLLEVAGAKAADGVYEQFNIGNNFPDLIEAQVSKWVAYNMMTWAASHMITDQLRQKRMYAQFNKLPTV